MNDLPKIIFAIALTILLLTLLWKFDVFKSQASKDAEKLGESGGALDTASSVTKDVAKDIKKKYGSIKPKLSTNKWNSWASRIWNAKGTFNDDEDVIYSVFREGQNQYDIKAFTIFFKLYFENKKHLDLYEYLSTFMNEDELQRIYKIIEQKPKV